MRRTPILLSCLLVLATLDAPAAAQEWAGRGRARGEVKDDKGKPVEGGSVFLRRGVETIDPADPGPGPKVAVTDAKGRWIVAGIAGGEWAALVTKEGYLPAAGPIQINEFETGKPIETVLSPIPQEYLEAQAEAEAMKGVAAAVVRGNEALGRNDTAAARTAYEEALAGLKDVKQHPELLRGIARTYYAEGQVDQAVATLKRALDVVPDDDDTDTLRLLVDMLMAAGREAEAEPYLAKLPAGTSVDPTTILNLGINRYNEGKMEEALAQFERVVEEHPTLGPAYYYRGLALLGLGKTAEAKADFEKFLELDPNHAKAADAREFLQSL
jgi:tetratricopeptide (TPR) repeat protein